MRTEEKKEGTIQSWNLFFGFKEINKFHDLLLFFFYLYDFCAVEREREREGERRGGGI